ncbi:hypothetical protein KSB_08300 [Ktedonobacter robiniae]|uniref:Uncharacterized protein n=1 Tax=Ktedonobacter robiniae TaxID=2778365 RepID=A0ABQ3UIB8_9CHLR|nr:hypothetical protein KSB_08300 [Ktedonobacter robiniae]
MTGIAMAPKAPRINMVIKSSLDKKTGKGVVHASSLWPPACITPSIPLPVFWCLYIQKGSNQVCYNEM